MPIPTSITLEVSRPVYHGEFRMGKGGLTIAATLKPGETVAGATAALHKAADARLAEIEASEIASYKARQAAFNAELDR